MKKLLFLLVILLHASIAMSHPGKTDRHGGHKCWKGCAEWELTYGEYHLHDKDFRPIRISRQGDPPVPAPSEVQAPVNTETPNGSWVSSDVRGPAETVTVRRQVVNVYEENIFPFDPVYLLLAAALLLLLLLILKWKRRKT